MQVNGNTLYSHEGISLSFHSVGPHREPAATQNVNLYFLFSRTIRMRSKERFLGFRRNLPTDNVPIYFIKAMKVSRWFITELSRSFTKSDVGCYLVVIFHTNFLNICI